MNEIRTRFLGVVQGEIDRLETRIAEAKKVRNFQLECFAIEALAAIKARVEMLCIQVEFASRVTATMPKAQTDNGKIPGIRSLIMKSKGGVPLKEDD